MSFIINSYATAMMAMLARLHFYKMTIALAFVGTFMAITPGSMALSASRSRVFAPVEGLASSLGKGNPALRLAGAC